MLLNKLLQYIIVNPSFLFCFHNIRNDVPTVVKFRVYNFTNLLKLYALYTFT